jgi:DNA-binding transcriptional LysR family regulator
MQTSDRIGRRIRLHDLNVLIAVVQAGSMNKAASLLNTGQSAISRSISDLEHAVGAQLLDRGPRGVEPTECGRALLSGGIAMFDELRQAVSHIEFLVDPTVGKIRIGTTIPLATSFVDSVIDRISRQHPRILFDLVTAQTDALHSELAQRNLDLLISWKRGPDLDQETAFEFLYDDSYVIVAGSNSPWARRRKVTLADLVNEAWTLPPPETVLGKAVVEAFRRGGLPPPTATVATLPREVRMRFLATGRFLTIFPASALKFSGQSPDVKVLPVELSLAGLSVGIVTLKGRTLSPVARLFIEHARKAAQPLAPDRRGAGRARRSA